jgi:ATP-binding cassette subfamily C (CFTR/MRP) protein 1
MKRKKNLSEKGTPYIQAIGGFVFAGNLLMYFVSEGLILGSSFVLYLWSDDPARDTADARNHYMLIYGGLGLAQTVMFYTKEMVLFLACAEASRTIHASLLERIMHKPMAFFDMNPTGRILNRFSADIDSVDQMIPFQLDDVLNCLAEVVGIIVLIAYSTPLFLVVMAPVSALYWLVQKFYIGASRQIRRLDSITKSPVFSHFAETIVGAATIRAFGAEQRFVLESEDLLALNNRCRWAFFNTNRWLGVRVENLGNAIILAAALLAVARRDVISAGLAGLSISYSLLSTGTLNWMVRNICALETNAVALERIGEYSEREEEAAWSLPQDADLPYNWPDRADLKGYCHEKKYVK